MTEEMQVACFKYFYMQRARHEINDADLEELFPGTLDRLRSFGRPMACCCIDQTFAGAALKAQESASKHRRWLDRK